MQGTHAGKLRENANILLPAAHHCERDGTLFNFEGRIQRIRRAVGPEGLSRPDWWITSKLAGRLGGKGWEYKKSADIYQEFASLHPGLKPIRLGSIGKKGKLLVQRGTARIDSALFAPDRKGVRTSEAFPLTLMLEGFAFRYRQRPLEERITGLDRIVPLGQIEIHPKDGRSLRIKSGELVRVKSREGAFSGRLRLSEFCPEGTVYAFFPWTQAVSTSITNRRTAVMIEKVKHE